MRSSRTCPDCGKPIVRAWVSNAAERIFDADPVVGGEWGIWTQSNRLNVMQRARLHTPDNHFGDQGHRLHDCPGPVGQQLKIGAA